MEAAASLARAIVVAASVVEDRFRRAQAAVEEDMALLGARNRPLYAAALDRFPRFSLAVEEDMAPLGARNRPQHAAVEEHMARRVLADSAYRRRYFQNCAAARQGWGYMAALDMAVHPDFVAWAVLLSQRLGMCNILCMVAAQSIAPPHSMPRQKGVIGG